MPALVEIRFRAIGIGAVALLLLVAACHLYATRDPGEATVELKGNKTLVVLAPPLGGAGYIPELRRLVQTSFPQSDILLPTYANNWFSNVDPLVLSDLIERAIHTAHSRADYDRIVLLGYSLGGVVLRKVLVWGYGQEQDRTGGGLFPLGKRGWVDKVDRFVSLAAPNRGWNAEERPEPMAMHEYVMARSLYHFGRATGLGYLMRSILRGSPFISNLRVQWINIARDPLHEDKLPAVIHLLGLKDELVNRDDSLDLKAAKDVVFKTIANATHLSIGTNIYADKDGSVLTESGTALREALTLERRVLLARWGDYLDPTKLPREDPSVRRIIYIMHGIRDEGHWIDVIQTEINRALPDPSSVRVIRSSYGRFPMGSFLLPWDRQHNVRWFMDRYTEDRAAFPRAVQFDFLGHSNGTYILASALRQYPTLKIDNVLFAGSVVPSHFDWHSLIEAKRVASVRNIVANLDLVVAVFPHVFQQIAQFLPANVRRESTVFDLGSAGFNGFQAATDVGGQVRDIKFLDGGHSAAIDVTDRAKLEAIVDFATSGSDAKFAVFDKPLNSNAIAGYISNVSWLIWLGLIAGVLAVGRIIAARSLRYAALYVGVMVALVFTI